MGWSLQLEPAPEKGTRAVVSIPLYAGESRPDGTVELRTDTETEQEQRRYHLRHVGAGDAHHAGARRPGEGALIM